MLRHLFALFSFHCRLPPPQKQTWQLSVSWRELGSLIELWPIYFPGGSSRCRLRKPWWSLVWPAKWRRTTHTNGSTIWFCVSLDCNSRIIRRFGSIQEKAHLCLPGRNFSILSLCLYGQCYHLFDVHTYVVWWVRSLAVNSYNCFWPKHQLHWRTSKNDVYGCYQRQGHSGGQTGSSFAVNGNDVLRKHWRNSCDLNLWWWHITLTLIIFERVG